MRYLNNWITQLTADFAPGATTLPIDPTYFALLLDAPYLLTLVNSLNPMEQTSWEIIKVTISSGAAVIERAQEDTTAQYWQAGSTIYCGVTAGGMNLLVTQMTDLAARVAAIEAGGGGTGPGDGGTTPVDGALTAGNGDLLIDAQNNQLIGG